MRFLLLLLLLLSFSVNAQPFERGSRKPGETCEDNAHCSQEDLPPCQVRRCIGRKWDSVLRKVTAPGNCETNGFKASGMFCASEDPCVPTSRCVSGECRPATDSSGAVIRLQTPRCSAPEEVVPLCTLTGRRGDVVSCKVTLDPTGSMPSALQVSIGLVPDEAKLHGFFMTTCGFAGMGCVTLPFSTTLDQVALPPLPSGHRLILSPSDPDNWATASAVGLLVVNLMDSRAPMSLELVEIRFVLLRDAPVDKPVTIPASAVRGVRMLENGSQNSWNGSMTPNRLLRF